MTADMPTVAADDRSVAKEKGIDPDRRHQRHRGRVAAASRKVLQDRREPETRFNTETGQVDLFAVQPIVEEVTSAGDARFR